MNEVILWRYKISILEIVIEIEMKIISIRK